MKKPYLMNITETQSRQVIVWAEDRNKAVNITNELCGKGSIDMTEGDYSLNVSVQFKAQDYDFNIFEQFNGDEE